MKAQTRIKENTDLVAADYPLVSRANYGIQSYSGDVTIDGLNSRHSTAACSNQISELDTNFLNANEDYDLNRACQAYMDTLVDSISVNTTFAIRINEEAGSMLQSMEEEQAKEAALSSMAKLNMNPDRSALHAGWQKMRMARNWQQSNRAEIDMEYALLMSDTVIMQQAFAGYKPRNASKHFLYGLQKRRIELQNGFTLSLDEQEQLRAMAMQEDDLSTKAKSLLYNQTGEYGPAWSPLYYKPTLVKTDRFTQFSDLIVFPNPAEEEVFLVLNNLKHPIQTLIVFDASGKKVFEKVLQKQGGVERIPIGSFQPGLFLIQGIDTEGKAKHSRIIKK